jgi:DNA-binding transcriptional ArsR family regulator
MRKKIVQKKTTDPVALFKILADCSRYDVLMLLHGTRAGLLVGEIADMLGVSHSTTSHLLARLQGEGIVIRKKEGRSVRYRMHTTPLARTIARLARMTI